MSIIVYWTQTDPETGATWPASRNFASSELLPALDFVKELREGVFNSHVCLSSELENSVGKPGVDSVEKGRLPDGSKYSWVKRRPPDRDD